MINFKAGDKVWVLCTAIGDSTMESVPVEHCRAEFYASVVDCKPADPEIRVVRVGDIENIATASEIDAKTKQCIVDYFMKKINEMAEKGYSRWWTTESHIINSKHLESVLEYFKENGYTVERCYESAYRVCIGW
jgi:hypothetical protein